VTWINAQDDIHEVMSESVPEGAKDFESPSIEKKDQKWSYTFTQSGTYRYHCHPHEALNMRGVIIVDHPSAEAEETEHHHHGESLTAAQAEEHLHSGKPVYSCPMHTHVFSEAPGRCPICGMDLRRVKEVKDEQAVIGEDKNMSMPEPEK
jgi:rubrerythrin